MGTLEASLPSESPPSAPATRFDLGAGRDVQAGPVTELGIFLVNIPFFARTLTEGTMTMLDLKDGLVLCVLLGQIIFSHFWLRAFRFGPIGWLRRSASYVRLQPMRR